MVYAWSENFVLPISHDEVVHGKGSLLGKMPGDRWQQLANLRAYLAYQWSHPGKQLLFMGSEFAQEGEWTDGRSLDWWLLDQPAHNGIHALVKDLNSVYRAHPAMWQLDHVAEGFQCIDANDATGNTFSFLRFGSAGPDGQRQTMASIVNFSGGPHNAYRLGLPRPGRWNEIVNTDSESYGGSGVGNLGSVVAEALPWHGQPYSALLTLPPLGALWLAPDKELK
jgi:1,4-alpha-glucan branching enzyme